MNSKEKYRLFCKSEKMLPIFSKDWYLDAVYENQWDVAIVEQNGKIIAALPYCFQRKLFFKYIKSHPFTKMLGPYLSPKIRNTKRANKVLTQLINQLPNIYFFQQNFHYDFTDWLPLKKKGYTQTTRYSYIIDDLIELGSVWKNIDANYRNNKIKKADSEFKVKTNLPVKGFFDLNINIFKRQNIPKPYSFEEFEKLDIALKKNNSRKIFYALNNQQQILSAIYLIWDNQTAYLHFTGDNINFRNTGAGILLIWKAIQFTKNELGLNRFDFEGSMLENIEQVRRDFGARQIPYFQIQKTSVSFLNLIYDLKKINYTD